VFLVFLCVGLCYSVKWACYFFFLVKNGDMVMSNNDDLTLAQASFQLSPQAQQNAKAKMLKFGSSIVCSSRTP
jgi:hypothetical protein